MKDDRPPLVFETPGGLSVSYQGRLLYSGRDPARLPQRLAAACDPGPARLHLVPSPLLWYGVPELLAAMGEGSALLCVEANPQLATLALAHMPSNLLADKRVTFIETSSIEAAVDAARNLGSFRACSLAALSGGKSPDTAFYSALASVLSADFEASWRNRAALMILGPRWARNIFDNIAALPTIAPGPLPLFPAAVMVCGAGPSLEEALPLILRVRSRLGVAGLGVIACDTALGTLLGAGIEPDLVICLEGQAHNLSDFTCLGSRSVALAADISSHPATFHAMRGRKFLTLTRITPSPFLARVEDAMKESGLPFLSVPPLGSVGVHAVHIAALLADGPLLAAGLDFSFETGKTHARGCPSLLAEERHLSRLTRWPGQYAASFRDRTMATDHGEPPSIQRLSDPILLSYAALLENRFGDSGILDLRTGGPSIGGRRVSPAQAESLLSTPDIPSTSRRDGYMGTEAASFDAERASRVLRLFLKDEQRRLNELRLSMRGTNPLRKEEFLSLASESDYLWWGFPDQDRARELPQDFLNRLVPQVEYWSHRIRTIAASIE